MVSLHGAGRQYDWLMNYAGFLDLAEHHRYVVVTPLGYTRRGRDWRREHDGRVCQRARVSGLHQPQRFGCQPKRAEASVMIEDVGRDDDLVRVGVPDKLLYSGLDRSRVANDRARLYLVEHVTFRL